MTGKDVLLYVTTGLAIIGFLGAFTEVPEAVDSLWTLVSNTAFFNGNSEVTGDSQAGSFTLNGTSITDWSAVNQSSGGGSSFVYSDYFNQSLNTSDSVTFDKIGLGNKLNPNFFIDYSGNLSGSSVANFVVDAKSGISSALTFTLDIPSTASATGTIGALGFYNKINEKKDRSGSSLIEGMRNEIGTNSVVQTGGTTDIKTINNIFNFKQNTGGTQNVYGTYSSFTAPLILGGSPTYNLYGHYVSGAQTAFDIASGTVNRYGYYATGFSKGTYDDLAYSFYGDGIASFSTLDSRDIIRLTPKATAPASCSQGSVYMDTSGGYCVCTSTNTWTNAVAVGSCV